MKYDKEINFFKTENYEINLELVYDFIKQNGLSIKSFCKNCKISIQEFYKIKNNNLTFKYISIVKISLYTKIKLKYLITNFEKQKIQTIFTL